MCKTRHLEYVRKKSGSNTVVLFVHGILGTPNHFKQMTEAVPEDWSVFNMLLKGHGGTVDSFAASGMKEWKNQVSCQVDALAAEYDHIIIVAHSMGTLFAMEAGLRVPAVDALYLLNVPLKVYLHPRITVDALKVIFEKVGPKDKTAAAMQKAYSITPDRRLWKYIKWAPNYLALLLEIRRVRRKAGSIKIPCKVYQSRCDELVRKSAAQYFEHNENVNVSVLEQSGHFYYEPSDMACLVKDFKSFCRSFQNRD